MPVTPERCTVPLRAPQAVPSTDAIAWWPVRATDRPGLVLAHGAGSDLTDPVLRGIARALAERGVPVLTFTFAYAAAGRRRPDPMPRLEAAYRDAAAAAADRFARPLVLGGRSLGGRVASRLAAADHPQAGVCLLGYPLHPAGRPDRLRTDHWPALDAPVLLVSGDRDRLCDLDLLHQELPKIPGPTSVRIVTGADHAFTVRKRDGRSAAAVLTDVVDAVDAWLDALPLDAGQVAQQR